ncbi:serine/threonine-protein kinase PknK [Haliangium sp.]|uniref:serine/threonine-protein kinase n=1 Tax=Haliangium sp. TaxID=2663208 RepID=UPI003D0F92AD
MATGYLHPDDLVDHRFRIEREIATGGMGRVYRARDQQTGKAVAIKVLGYQDATARERFLDEAVLLARLRHPGIVRYVAHGVMAGGDPYLAMEWLAGENLAQYLRRRPSTTVVDARVRAPTEDEDGMMSSPVGAQLTLSQTLQLGRRLAEAVGQLHDNGFVHRDIKPDNLFLADGDIEQVKLIDFGTIRHRTTSGQRTEPGHLVGTPFYMSPEQARSNEEVGPTTDVWGIGCVLYECLTGYKAFWADNIMVVLTHILLDDPIPVRERRPEVPEAVAELVMQTLNKDPSRRPSDAMALAKALQQLGAAIGTADTLPSGATETATEVRAQGSSPHALTGVERRVSCLLYAGHAPDHAPPAIEPLAQAVEPIGADVQRLANGCLLVSLRGTGAPIDQASRAALAALALRSTAPALSMVLATGRVEGPRQMPQIRALTQAARALSQLAPGTIRLDDDTATVLDARFDIHYGPDGPTLAGERPHEATRTLLGKPSRWVGRRRELETLAAIFAECAEEAVARAVLVTAPAGMGKSRLRYELERVLRDRGYDFEVLRGRGDAVAAGSPFIMLAPAIRRFIGLRDGDSLETERAQLVGRVAQVVPAPERARVTAFLGEMIGVGFPDDDDDALRAARGDAMLRNQLMQAAWQDWLAAECERKPLLLVLEDLHWGDLPSVQYIDGALRALGDAPLMVLALARPEVHSTFHNLWSQRALSEIPLHPLPRRASKELILDSLGADLDDEVIDAILVRAGGNAFYLEELIRAVSENHHYDSASLPATIVGMVQARLDRLGNEAKRVLRAASIFGEVFWKEGTKILLGDSGVFKVHEWLDDLVEAELIQRQPESRLPGLEEYSFRHALVRDGAYAMLTAEDRRLGHALAGNWLEAQGERDHLVLAEHYMRGGEPGEAIPHFQRAATQALESNDLAAATQRAERAIMAGAQGAMRGALRSLQSVAEYWLGDYARSRYAGAEAAELLPSGSGEWFAAVGSALVSSARLGDHDQVARFFDVALSAECAPGAEAAQLICLCRGAFQLVFHGHLDRADEILPRIAKLADAARERDALDALTEAQVCHLHSVRRAQTGVPTAFLGDLQEAVAAFERAGDIRNVALERTTVAWTWAELGFLDRAAEMCERNLRDAQVDGNLAAATYAKVNLGYILTQLEGRLSEARTLLEDAIEVCHQAGNSRLEGWARAHLAWVEHKQERHVDEERQAAQAIELLAATPGLQAWALAVRVRALLALDRADEAVRLADQAVDMLDQLGGLLQGIALPPLMRALARDATGDLDGAHDAARDAVRRLHERARSIDDPEWRRRYLDLEDNRLTLVLARTWGVDA